MPWNREKIRKELDRKHLVKGIYDIRFELDSELAENNILDLLNSGEPTNNQILNSLYLLNEYMGRTDKDIKGEDLLELYLKYWEVLEGEKREILVRYLIGFCSNVSTYRGFEHQKKNIKNIFEKIEVEDPKVYQEFSPLITYIKERESITSDST